MFQNGHGVKKDFDQAVKWYQKAADQGDTIAKNKLKNIQNDKLGIANRLSKKGGIRLDKNTALIYAAKQGNIAAIEKLIKKGADVNTKDNYRNTPLMSAATAGNLEAVKFLISQNAKINVINNANESAIHLASQ